VGLGFGDIFTLTGGNSVINSGDDENSGGYLYDVFDPLDMSGQRAKNSLAGQSAKMAALREKAKRTQIDYLNSMQGPSLTPQQEARIRALETESTRPMLEDPNYGFQVGQATRGGAQALSSIQNKQRATGATGGFQNIGSMSDVYDRVGGQLSQIAQQNQAIKEQKRDQAAELRQNIADGQIAFQNSIRQARMAIEAGDAATTQAALQAAYNAKQQITQSTKQMIFSIAGTVGGAFAGGPMGASMGGQVGKAAAGSAPQDTGPVSGSGGGYVGGNGSGSSAWDGQSVLNSMNAGQQSAANRPYYSITGRGR
jgi:hypothetical protein